MERAACGRALASRICTKRSLYMADRGQRPEGPPPHYSVGVQTRRSETGAGVRPNLRRYAASVNRFPALSAGFESETELTAHLEVANLQSLDAAPRHIHFESLCRLERCTLTERWVDWLKKIQDATSGINLPSVSKKKAVSKPSVLRHQAILLKPSVINFLSSVSLY